MGETTVPMKCKEVMKLLPEYAMWVEDVDATMAAISQHMDLCPECKGHLEAELLYRKQLQEKMPKMHMCHKQKGRVLQLILEKDII